MRITEAAKKRAARLCVLRAELARSLGYSEDQVAADSALRERVNAAAILRLQHELVSARLVGGDTIGTDELIRLTQAVADILPRPVPKGPQALTVNFITGFDVKMRAWLEERPDLAEHAAIIQGQANWITKLEAERDSLQAAVAANAEQIKRLSESAPLPGAHVAPSQGPGAASHEAPAEVVPLHKHAALHSVLASVNAGMANPAHRNPALAHGREYCP